MISSSMHLTHFSCMPGRTTYWRSSKNIAGLLSLGPAECIIHRHEPTRLRMCPRPLASRPGLTTPARPSRAGGRARPHRRARAPADHRRQGLAAGDPVGQRGTGAGGIGVVGDGGGASTAAREILKVCARQRLVVHTGHSSAEQALALIVAAREAGCERIVVTHAQFEVVGMNEAQMKKAAAMGAKLELCALGMLVGPDSPLEWMRESIRVPLKDT